MTAGSQGRDESPVMRGDVVVRQLDNGFGMWTCSVPSSSGGLAVGLHVAVGSLCETEQERGLSHLIEHLAFHGGRHFPPGALERFFDLHGTRLGRHHNAHTGPDKTCFSLSFPEYAPDTLDRAVACLADFAFGIEAEAAVVEQERRVVLEEMRGHEGARSRVRNRLVSLVLPGSLIARRHPLGAREVIEVVTAEELRAYYGRWYRPDTCTIVAVGQVTEHEVAEVVESYFGSWCAEGAPPPAPDPGVTSYLGGVCDVIVDPDAVEASAHVVRAFSREPHRSHEQLVERSLQGAAIWLLGRRLGELAFDDSGPVRDLRIIRSPLACTWQLIDVAAATTSRGAVKAVAALVTELRRISEHGFGPTETQSTAGFLRRSARQLLRQQEHRPLRALLQELLDAVSSGGPPPSAEQRHDIIAELAECLDPSALRDSLESVFTASDGAAVVVLPSGMTEYPSTKQLSDAVRQASSAPTSAPVHHPRPSRLLDRLPPPGTVKNCIDHGELGVRSLSLENGVAVHILPLAEGTDRAIVQLTLAGGRILETPDNVGLTTAAALAFSHPAADGVPSRLIRDRLAETTVTLTCSMDEDCVTLRLTSDPEDLEQGFELLHLLLSRPQVEPAALMRWQTAFEGFSTDRPPGIEAQIAQTSMRLLTGGDHRFRMLARERVEAITVEAAQQWLERELCDAPLELAVVGAVDRDRTAEQVLRFLASLPDRPEHDPRLAALRTVAVPQGRVAESVDAQVASSKAGVMVGWRAAPWHDEERRQPLHMATHVLAQRIHHQIRQRGGLSYDVDCSYSPSRAYPEASLLAVTLYTPPRRADEAVAAVRELVEGFAADGPGESEMESVRRLFSELATKAQRAPRFWARVLPELRYRGGSLDELMDLPGRCLRRTSGEIHRAIADSVRPDRRITVLCRPPGAEEDVDSRLKIED